MHPANRRASLDSRHGTFERVRYGGLLEPVPQTDEESLEIAEQEERK